MSFLPCLFSDMICPGALQAHKGGSPADSHNSTHWPSAAFLALTGAAIDFPSFMQLIGSAHREGVLFGKRAMAAGQENPARAPGASPCQCSHTWHHPSTTLHAQQQRRGSQPMKHSSSAVSGGNSTAKAGFPSCPHIPPLLSEQAHTDLPIACFYLALSPSFLPLHFIVIRKVLKRCKLWKAINFHWPFKPNSYARITWLLKPPPSLFRCSIRSSQSRGKWDSLHENLNRSDFSFT